MEISFSLEINYFDSFAEINITCSALIQNVYFIHVNPMHKLILDKTLNLNGLNIGRSYNGNYFYFSNLKGINLNFYFKNALKPTFNSNDFKLQVALRYSKFDFYLPNETFLESEAYCNSYRVHELQSVYYSSKICPLLFMSLNIFKIFLKSVSNSFLNKNRFLFMNINIRPIENI